MTIGSSMPKYRRHNGGSKLTDHRIPLERRSPDSPPVASRRRLDTHCDHLLYSTEVLIENAAYSIRERRRRGGTWRIQLARRDSGTPANYLRFCFRTSTGQN